MVRDQGVGDTQLKVPWGVLTMNETQQQAKTMVFRFILKFTRTVVYPSLLYPWKPVMMLQKRMLATARERNSSNGS